MWEFKLFQLFFNFLIHYRSRLRNVNVFIFHCNWCVNTFSHIIWIIVISFTINEQIICTSQWIFFRKNNRLHLTSIKYRLSVFNLKRVIFVFEKQNLIWTFGSQQSPSSAIFNLKILHLTVVIAVFMMGLHDLVIVTVTLVTKRICRILYWFRFVVNTLFNYSARQQATLGAYSS